MIPAKIKCPTCGSEEVVKFGKSTTGAQRYCCRSLSCVTDTFQLNYTYIGCEKNPFKPLPVYIKTYNVRPLEV